MTSAGHSLRENTGRVHEFAIPVKGMLTGWTQGRSIASVPSSASGIVPDKKSSNYFVSSAVVGNTAERPYWALARSSRSLIQHRSFAVEPLSDAIHPRIPAVRERLWRTWRSDATDPQNRSNRSPTLFVGLVRAPDRSQHRQPHHVAIPQPVSFAASRNRATAACPNADVPNSSAFQNPSSVCAYCITNFLADPSVACITRPRG